MNSRYGLRLLLHSVLRRQHPSGGYSSLPLSCADIQTDDWANGAAGGCAAGFTAGVKARSLPMAIGACAGMATLIGTFEAAGSVSVEVDYRR